jgi:hypothetical protein
VAGFLSGAAGSEGQALVSSLAAGVSHAVVVVSIVDAGRPDTALVPLVACRAPPRATREMPRPRSERPRPPRALSAAPRARVGREPCSADSGTFDRERSLTFFLTDENWDTLPGKKQSVDERRRWKALDKRTNLLRCGQSFARGLRRSLGVQTASRRHSNRKTVPSRMGADVSISSSSRPTRLDLFRRDSRPPLIQRDDLSDDGHHGNRLSPGWSRGRAWAQA